MIRIVCYEDDIGDVVYGGARTARRTVRTFDVDAPELEAWLRQYERVADELFAPSRGVLGVEVLPAPKEPA